MLQIIKQPKQFRENVVSKLNGYLKNEKKSLNLEKGMFNYCIREATTNKIVKKWDNVYFVLLYKNKMKSIFANIEKILSLLESDKTIEIEKLAFLNHQELDVEKWGPIIDEKIKRDKLKFETNVEASSDLFKCGKCGGRRTTFYELQTRSCDEPQTCFITCLDCGKRWRQ